MKKKFYVIMNNGNSEGYITDNPDNIVIANGNDLSVNPKSVFSVLADAFKRIYWDSDKNQFEIEMEI